MYVCIYPIEYMYTYTDTAGVGNRLMYVCMYVCMNLCIYLSYIINIVFIDKTMCVCIYVCVCVCVCMRVRVRVCVYRCSVRKQSQYITHK